MAAEHFSYLLHYARTGSVSWIAHLDLMRMFERAILRACLPVYWSQGFNPRPDLEFALPVGVGIETRNDPFLLGLTVALDADELFTKLQGVLPDGLTLVSCVPFDRSGRSLMARVVAADYEIHLPGIERYAPLLEGATSLPVQKQSKKKLRDVDVRSAIQAFHLPDADHLKITLAAGSQRNVRPELLLDALASKHGDPPGSWHDADIIRLGVVIN